MGNVRWLTAVVILPAAVLLGFNPAQGDEENIPSIKDIMRLAHRGCGGPKDNNYLRLIREELAKESPDWQVVESRSRELVRLGRILGQHTPPRGSLESWRKITDLYVAHATILVDAAEHRDKTIALQHWAKVGNCRACHVAHKQL